MSKKWKCTFSCKHEDGKQEHTVTCELNSTAMWHIAQLLMKDVPALEIKEVFLNQESTPDEQA